MSVTQPSLSFELKITIKGTPLKIHITRRKS